MKARFEFLDSIYEVTLETQKDIEALDDLIENLVISEAPFDDSFTDLFGEEAAFQLRGSFEDHMRDCEYEIEQDFKSTLQLIREDFDKEHTE